MIEAINERYMDWKEYVDRAVSEKDWWSAITMHIRPFRLRAFLDYESEMSHQDYWSNLSDIWQDCEYPCDSFGTWCELFTSSRVEREKLMNDDEHKRLTGLPEILTIYRGVSGGFHRGLSWTLDEEVVIWFATRSQHQDPALLAGTCRKRDILALFLRREESEVVILPDLVTRQSVTPIPTPSCPSKAVDADCLDQSI